MRALFFCVLLLWAVAFFGSFAASLVMPASLTGAATASEKIVIFGAGQIASALLAMLCLMFRWGSQDRMLRRLASLPALIVGMLVAGAMVLWLLSATR